MGLQELKAEKVHHYAHNEDCNRKAGPNNSSRVSGASSHSSQVCTKWRSERKAMCTEVEVNETTFACMVLSRQFVSLYSPDLHWLLRALSYGAPPLLEHESTCDARSSLTQSTSVTTNPPTPSIKV